MVSMHVHDATRKTLRLFLLLLLLGKGQGQSIPCQTDQDCINHYQFHVNRSNFFHKHNNSSSSSQPQQRPISTCLVKEGVCTNPYAQGCLITQLPSDHRWFKARVCNSEDEDSSNESCRRPLLFADTLEIRLLGQNWESSLMQVWLLQILLSELLDIPTTIETGQTGTVNLYHPTAALDYHSITLDYFVGFETAHDIGDCRLLREENLKQNTSYTPCLHYSPEMWDVNRPQTLDFFFRGIVEPFQALGILGEEGWYIPLYTAQQDPSLLSYLGLIPTNTTTTIYDPISNTTTQVETTRAKLARLFKRPTTWQDYCAMVSPSNCTLPNTTAVRAPRTEDEANSYFVDGLFQGYFRYTEDNDCVRHPHNCTGHLADYPCGWSSATEPNVHHLQIPLKIVKSYTPMQMLQIWKAANATRENVMIQWYSPQELHQTLRGTPAEFVKVSLLSPTEDCIQNRVLPEDQCVENTTIRVGDPRGACDDPTRPIQKVLSSYLASDADHPDIPEAIRSPAYDVLRLFSFSELQLDQIFALWRETGDMRQSVCQWAAANLEDYLDNFVPMTYPRVVLDVADQEDGSNITGSSSALQTASTVVAGLVVGVVCLVALGVYYFRRAQSVRLAQIEFLWLLLAGSLLTAVGAVLAGIGVSSTGNTSCVAENWFIDVGYSLGLVPLIVKIAAVQRLVHASRRFRRAKLNLSTLFGCVAGIAALTLVYLILWTILDSPRKTPEYQLTDNKVPETNETIVEVHYYCETGSDVWPIIPIAWYFILLFCTSILAFQARKIDENLSESRTFAILIYSHFMFAMLRLATFFVSSTEISHVVIRQVRSLLVSTDTFASMVIYFVPKLWYAWRPDESDFRQSSSSRFFGSTGNNWGGRSGTFHTRRGGPFGRFFIAISHIPSWWMHDGAEDSQDVSPVVLNDINNDITSSTSRPRVSVEAEPVAPEQRKMHVSSGNSSGSKSEQHNGHVVGSESVMTTEEDCPSWDNGSNHLQLGEDDIKHMNKGSDPQNKTPNDDDMAAASLQRERQEKDEMKALLREKDEMITLLQRQLDDLKSSHG